MMSSVRAAGNRFSFGQPRSSPRPRHTRAQLVIVSRQGGGPKTIPVVVNGAAGKMGREVVRAIAAARGLELAGAIDVRHVGEDAGEVAGLSEPLEIPISGALDLPMVLTSVAQDKERYGVLVDFSDPESVMETYKQAIAFGIRPVIGTSGISEEQLRDMIEFSDMATMGAIVSPSYSIGLALLQQAAASAAFHYSNIQVFETLNDASIPSPSHNAKITANGMSDIGRLYNQPAKGALAPVESAAMGAVCGDGIRVHSSYSPQWVSSQEVNFSSAGEQLSINHLVTDYKAYVPGVLLAIRRVVNLKSFVYGIDKLL